MRWTTTCFSPGGMQPGGHVKEKTRGGLSELQTNMQSNCLVLLSVFAY